MRAVEAATKVEAVTKVALAAARVEAAAKAKAANKLAAAKSRTAIRLEATVQAMTPDKANTAHPPEKPAKVRASVKARSGHELFAQGMSKLVLTHGQQHNASR